MIINLVKKNWVISKEFPTYRLAKKNYPKSVLLCELRFTKRIILRKPVQRRLCKNAL